MRRPTFTETLSFTVTPEMFDRLNSARATDETNGKPLSRAELCRRILMGGISKVERGEQVGV